MKFRKYYWKYGVVSGVVGFIFLTLVSLATGLMVSKTINVNGNMSIDNSTGIETRTLDINNKENIVDRGNYFLTLDIGLSKDNACQINNYSVQKIQYHTELVDRNYDDKPIPIDFAYNKEVVSLVEVNDESNPEDAYIMQEAKAIIERIEELNFNQWLTYSKNYINPTRNEYNNLTKQIKQCEDYLNVEIKFYEGIFSEQTSDDYFDKHRDELLKDKNKIEEAYRFIAYNKYKNVALETQTNALETSISSNTFSIVVIPLFAVGIVCFFLLVIFIILFFVNKKKYDGGYSSKDYLDYDSRYGF